MKLKFDVEGMHCASCAYRLQKHIRKLDGVNKATVNLASQSLLIDYMPDLIAQKKLIAEAAQLGYALIPVAQNAETGKVYENRLKRKTQKKQLRRSQLIVAWLFMVPLLVTGLSPLLGYRLPYTIDHISSPANYSVMQMLLCLPIILTGWRFLKNGWSRLLQLQINIDSLVALSATASLVQSFGSTIRILYQGDTPNSHPLYFVTAGAIIAVIMLGRFIENRLREGVENTMQRLISLLPVNTERIENEQPVIVLTSELKEDDLIRILPNSYIPVDGTVVSGISKIDESMLTGNRSQVLKSPESRVMAGMQNLEATLIIKATKTGSETILAGIIRLIEEGENSQPAIGRMADKISRWVVHGVLIVACIAAITWFGVKQDYLFSLEVFISVLVIACPVSIGLAIPISAYFSTHRASSLGILVRRTEAFSNILKAETVLFNLSGTITEGHSTVTEIIANNSLDADRLLSLAASAESESKHPIATAIIAKAREKALPIYKPDPVRLIAGEGIEAIVEDERVDIGNYKLMGLINIDTDKLNEAILTCQEFAHQGKTPLLIAVEGELQGIIVVANRLRPEAREVVQQIQQWGKEVVILTGEHASTAQSLARQVAVDYVLGDILPINRARQIRKFQHEGKKVLMVGDGWNDAEALAQADTGVVLGLPDNVPADAADVVLLNNDMRALITLMRLSSKTMSNIRLNIFLAFVFNLLMVPVAAGILHLFGVKFMLNPMIAVVVMFLGFISVLLNALRLRKFR